jgi:hypothetical protein
MQGSARERIQRRMPERSWRGNGGYFFVGGGGGGEALVGMIMEK